MDQSLPQSVYKRHLRHVEKLAIQLHALPSPAGLLQCHWLLYFQVVLTSEPNSGVELVLGLLRHSRRSRIRDRATVLTLLQTHLSFPGCFQYGLLNLYLPENRGRSYHQQKKQKME